MITSQGIREYVKDVPFRPFRIHMASGQTFEVRHPEMIKVLKNYVLIFIVDGGGIAEVPDEFTTVSLLLAESLSYLEAEVH